MSMVFSILGIAIVVLIVWSLRTFQRTSDETTEGHWAMAWRQFRKRTLNLLGMSFVGMLFFVAFFADFLASDLPIVLHLEGKTHILPNLTRPTELVKVNNTRLLSGLMVQGDWALLPPIPYGPNEDLGQLRTRRLEAPHTLHPLGTDDRGRDVAARMILGTRVTLMVGLLAVSLYVFIGLLLGATAGFFGGRLDTVIGRITEVFMSFPSFFLILTIQALLPTTAGMTSVMQLVLVIGVTRWTEVSRLVRAEVMRTKVNDYVAAAQAAGLSNTRILLRYVLPNSIGPVLVAATFGVAGAVLLESGLSFLGFGVQPPMASWGELLQQARETRVSWMVLYPGMAVFLSVTMYNLVGEGLRDALDPRLRS